MYSTLQVEKGDRAWGQCEVGRRILQRLKLLKGFPVWINKIRKPHPISSGRGKGKLASAGNLVENKTFHETETL